MCAITLLKKRRRYDLHIVTFSEKKLTVNAGLLHLGRFAEKLGLGEMLRKGLKEWSFFSLKAKRRC